MLTRCTHCGCEYQIDPAGVGAAGLQVCCSRCDKMFLVTPLGRPGQLLVRHSSGTLYHPGDLATLQRWIVERRLERDDLLAQDGQSWQRLGNIVELVPFFMALQQPLVPELAAAAGFEPPVSLSARPHTAMPRLTPPPLNAASMTTPFATGSLQPPPRATQRRRTASVDIDDVLGDHFEPSGLFINERPTTSKPPRRHFPWLLTLVVLSSLGMSLTYVLRPVWVHHAIAFLRRGPIADIAVQQLHQGYSALAHDSVADYQIALQAFERAIKIDARFADARAGVAETHLALAESYRQAAEDLSAYDARPGAAPKDNHDKQIAQQRRAAAEALEHAFVAAQQALTLAPESVAANRASAEIYRLQGDPAKLQPFLTRASAASADDPRVELTRAALLADAQPEQAVDIYLQALAAAPELNRGRYRLARLFIKRGDTAHAMAQVEAILKTAPNHELGQALLQQLQPPVDGTEAPPPALSSAAPSSSRAPPASVPAASKAAPTVEIPLPSLVKSLKLAPVITVPPPLPLPHRPGLTLPPRPPQIHSVELVVPPMAAAVPAPTSAPLQTEMPATATYEALVAQGQLLRNAHQTASAAALYRRAIGKDAIPSAAYMGLGWCELELQDNNSAVAAFTTALKKSPWLAEAHYGLATAQRQCGDRREAIRHYRQVLALQPAGAIGDVARQMLEELSK